MYCSRSCVVQHMMTQKSCFFCMTTITSVTEQLSGSVIYSEASTAETCSESGSPSSSGSVTVRGSGAVAAAGTSGNNSTRSIILSALSPSEVDHILDSNESSDNSSPASR